MNYKLKRKEYTCTNCGLTSFEYEEDAEVFYNYDNKYGLLCLFCYNEKNLIKETNVVVGIGQLI